MDGKVDVLCMYVCMYGWMDGCIDGCKYYVYMHVYMYVSVCGHGSMAYSKQVIYLSIYDIVVVGDLPRKNNSNISHSVPDLYNDSGCYCGINTVYGRT